MMADPWEERLAPALEGKEGHIDVESVWTFLDIKADRQDPHTSQRVTQIMARLGFEKTKRRRGGPTLTVYSNGKANTFFSISRAGTAGTLGTVLGTD